MPSKHSRMIAFSIDDVPLGDVLTVRSCCFEIGMQDGIACITGQAIYGVEASRVTLISMADNVRSYACRLHGRPVPEGRPG